MSLDSRIIEHVAATTGVDVAVVRDVLDAAAKHPEYEVVRVADRPRFLRCRTCKVRMDADLIDRDTHVCESCRALQQPGPGPDDRDPSVSVRATSGGAFESSRRRH